jgi:cysteine synthase
MISITSKSPYAVAALAELGRSGGVGPVPIAELARRREMPVQFLEQLFAVLRRAGVVSSQRGVKGGYRFAREPSEITVLEIVELLDGPLGRDAEGVFGDASKAARDVLAATTIADVVERDAREAGASMYHILAGAPRSALSRSSQTTIVVVAMESIPINIAELVGRTPIVRLERMLAGTPAEQSGVELYAKLEAFNPGGSVKDRIGVAMIESAEAEGRIEPGRSTIVEATSGNTGIALAFVCAAKGYDLVLTLPQGMSREREILLKLYGAKVQITESLGGMSEAVQAAREMARDPDVFLPDQFSNPANPEAHRRTTGPEIDEVLDGRIDVLVAGVGTGGTITGVGEYLRERNPDLRVIAVEPRGSAVLSGELPGPHRLQGIGAGFVPPVLNREIIDEVIPVSDDHAIQTAWACARREGLLAGISSGAALWASMQVAGRPESAGRRIVTIMPDSGERYVSQSFFAPS